MRGQLGIVVRPAFYCRRSPVNRTRTQSVTSVVREAAGADSCCTVNIIIIRPATPISVRDTALYFSTELLTNNRPVQYALFPVSRDRDDTAIRLLYRTTPPVPRTDRVFRRRRRSLLLLLLLCAVASSWGMFSVRRDRVRITILLRCYYKQRRSDK